jgi:cation diffusion facilitator family transporter
VKSARLQRSVWATVLGLSVNVVLATTKLLAGIFGRSYALIADAIESMADGISSIIVWRGVVIAEKPPDKEHPYGHGKAEAIATAAVSAMLVGAALLIVVRSVKEIQTPRHVPAPYTLIVLLGVVLIKEGLFRIVGRVGEEVESGVVKAEAWHHRSDAITSAAAAFGISIALVGGDRYRSADDWAAIFAAAIIAFNGVRLLRPALDELMDAAPKEDIVGLARSIALQVNGVKGVEKCFARKMGYEYWLDMHIEVDGGLSVAVAHELSHTVKDAIRQKLPRVLDATIHIEPFPSSSNGSQPPA